MASAPSYTAVRERIESDPSFLENKDKLAKIEQLLRNTDAELLDAQRVQNLIRAGNREAVGAHWTHVANYCEFLEALSR